MDASQASSQISQGPQLPPGFKTIKEIQNASNQEIERESFVNVIGFVKDFQVPMQTRGSGKSPILEDESHGVKLTVFWALDKMPKINGSSDAVLVRKARLQMRMGAVQLKAHFTTEFHVMHAAEIPRDPSNLASASWHSYPPTRWKPPNSEETAYIASANASVGSLCLPSTMEFQEKTLQSMNVRGKFSLLKDVQAGRFYDILGEVIRVHEGGAGTSVYLSDYTANSNFYNYEWAEVQDSAEGRNGDEYGYRKKKLQKGQAWPGPYGKLTIQLTLYDGHAHFISKCDRVGQWVLLRNVKIDYGKMGGQLEGFLRGDRNAFEGKVQVEVVGKAEGTEQNDPRWIEAVHRKGEWRKKFKKQRQAIADEEADSGDKRKRGGEESKTNSKKRRKEKRAAAEKKAAELEGKKAKRLDLNENIRCAHPDQPIVSLAEILEPRKLMQDGDDQRASPFTLCKYRANVRVVDYFPHRLEDFAVGHRARDLDILSDYSGGEDTDLEEERRIFKSGGGFAKNSWEWRFALQVEDANAIDMKHRMWLMVDNHTAQGLLGLEDDATSLRRDKQLLSQLREQLFKLWGDLEERKSNQLVLEERKADIPASTMATAVSWSSSPLRAGEQPDADDSDVENAQSYGRTSGTRQSGGSVLKERDTNVKLTVNQVAAGKTSPGPDSTMAPKNKPFTCCIKQYGTKVDEADRTKADAGDGKRWQRMFGIFDTQIM
ncbi:hypothetical protein G7Y89_g14229 [Cudoniella acicularis]|uniref:Protection of telomeres protein 1 ssDNA-binding domain-containing protein n=1 Tax=Cudoniella acicularis TaxID=354080 RepID=A0A8H4VU42_9HELO|nr:hypothetical protein G7Y89_g14229 [Cudoniella acicularis]